MHRPRASRRRRNWRSAREPSAIAIKSPSGFGNRRTVAIEGSDGEAAEINQHLCIIFIDRNHVNQQQCANVTGEASSAMA